MKSIFVMPKTQNVIPNFPQTAQGNLLRISFKVHPSLFYLFIEASELFVRALRCLRDVVAATAVSVGGTDSPPPPLV